MAKIGLIDYGAGNFTSVYNALSFLKLDTIRICEPDQMEEATHLIMPGVGAFASAMRKLKGLKIADALRQLLLEQRKPFLGICVGMQLLASRGSEFEPYQGLDIIEGTVERIASEVHGLRLPHVGWNQLNVARKSPLFKNMPPSPTFYFVHSYHFRPSSTRAVIATCTYGTEITAAVQIGNIYGVQFHPEKSQQDGLRLLRNFAGIES